MIVQESGQRSSVASKDDTKVVRNNLMHASPGDHVIQHPLRESIAQHHRMIFIFGDTRRYERFLYTITDSGSDLVDRQ